MKKKLPSTSAFTIPRSHFEDCGWRTVTIARGQVTWPDGKVQRLNVRLSASPGNDGAIHLYAEDINTGKTTRIPLTRKP
jgi:hypothetical protein